MYRNKIENLKFGKIFVYPKYGRCTPFAYKEYRKYFKHFYQYIDNKNDADFLITGNDKDFINDINSIAQIKKKNPQLRLIVLSEEPFWDTALIPFNDSIHSSIEKKGIFKKQTINYTNLNHVNACIFNFEKIPYFITTNDNFYTRYANLFSRNIKLSESDFLRNWENAKIRYAFLAARRVGKNFDVSFNDRGIIGLSRFRSLVCEGMKCEGVLREGKGWGTEQPRQALPDWHLDKLAKLDKNSFVVSALENTHLDNYVSEKIFDAFAVGAIPIYYAQPQHKVFELVPEGSFINVVGKSIEEAIKTIEEFKIDDTFMKNYMKAQKQLAELFLNQKYYIDERRRVVDETVKAFSKIKQYKEK